MIPARLLLFAVLILIAFSCTKKVEELANAREILMKHAWYPEQTQILKVDSITTRTIYPNNTTQERTSVVRSDTSFFLIDCMRQTTYRFGDNGKASFKDMCHPAQADSTAFWNLSDGNMLSFPFRGNVFGPPTGHGIAYGALVKITHTEFVFATNAGVQYSKTTDEPNGTRIYEGHKVSITERMTYKSR